MLFGEWDLCPLSLPDLFFTVRACDVVMTHKVKIVDHILSTDWNPASKHLQMFVFFKEIESDQKEKLVTNLN